MITGTYKTERPGRSRRSSEKVVNRLREMIQRGELSYGDRLPPERDLAKLFGVSRPTLRDVIRSLAAVGVLESKRGSGTFIKEAEKSPTLDGSSFRLMAALHGFTPAEMFEARLALEMCIVGLAAERATSEQMTSMSEEVVGMFAALDEPEQFLFHDMNFHQAVAAASGNRILTALVNMIVKILCEARAMTVTRATDLKESAEMHRDIYRAIRQRSPEAARATMREHLLLAEKAQAQEALR